MDTNMKIENCNIPGVKIIYNDMAVLIGDRENLKIL